MKVTILGNNGVFPEAGGACSSYLVQTENYNLLIDMGPGSLAKLQRKISIDAIDIFIFSHLHFDYISDFFSLKYALQLKKSRGDYHKRPILLLPQNPSELYEMVRDEDLFDVLPLRDGLDMKLKNTRLTFAEMTHPVESYAVRVSEKEKSMVYSGDTDRPDRIREFARDADLFLSDAGLLAEHKAPGAPHMSVAEACAAGEFAKKTLLVHLSPLYTRDQIAKELTNHAKISRPGCECEL